MTKVIIDIIKFIELKTSQIGDPNRTKKSTSDSNMLMVVPEVTIRDFNQKRHDSVRKSSRQKVEQKLLRNLSNF